MNGFCVPYANKTTGKQGNALDGIGIIQLSSDILGGIETSIGETHVSGWCAVNLNSIEKNFAYYGFTSTLFHEGVHYGRFKTGIGNWPEEYGKKWEKLGMGRDFTKIDFNKVGNKEYDKLLDDEMKNKPYTD